MTTQVGFAKASKSDDFPLSISLQDVTVVLESYEINREFDCSNCFYMNSDDICGYQKQISIKPTANKHLHAVAIVVHIINASNSDVGMGSHSWNMVDSLGYAFKGIDICNEFYSRRLQRTDTVLSATQARHLIIFPEMEKDIVPSLFILEAGLMEYRFEVAEMSESVKHLLKPPKPLDSVIDKTKAYIQSDSYRRFLNTFQESEIEINQQSLDFVIANLACNYYSYIGNSDNVWDNEKQLLEYYPYIVSIAEICSFEFAEKTIITIPNQAIDACKAIIHKHNIDYKVYPVHILGQDITAIILVQKYSSHEELRKVQNSIGRLVLNEVNASKISNGACILSKDPSKVRNPSLIHLSGLYELDISDISRNANAGYREDLHEAFRSSWEANVARALRVEKRQYKYESKVFEMKRYNYLPDFILEDGTILEVKGVWDVESLGKMHELHKTYPSLRIFPLDSDMYYDLCKRYGNMSNWEGPHISVHSNILTVVGLPYVSDQSVFETINIGTQVLLVREPENQYDNYAVLVTTVEGKPLGHLKAEWAVVYAPKIDAGIEYKATIVEKTTKAVKIEAIRANTEQLTLYDCFISKNPLIDECAQLEITYF